MLVNPGHAKISSYPGHCEPVGWFYPLLQGSWIIKDQKGGDIHQFSHFVFSKIKVELVIDDTFSTIVS